jgi:hypothetical protein
VVFTDNRRVMISVGDAGETLRVNRCFRDAPAEVRRAIGALYARGGAAGRERARATIRAFLAEVVPQAARAGRAAVSRARPTGRCCSVSRPSSIG